MSNRWRQTPTSSQKFPRHPAQVPVRIATVDPERDPETGLPFFRNSEASTGNLSRGGVFVHSWEPLAAGRRVIVALALPAGGELELLGRVVWTRRRVEQPKTGTLEAPGYGIEFIGETRADQAAIQQILDATATGGATGARPTEAPAGAAVAPTVGHASGATKRPRRRPSSPTP